MNRPWAGSVTQFMRATRNSYEKTVVISTYTAQKLAACDDVPALKTYFDPIHLSLADAYDIWCIYRAQQGSCTRLFHDQLSGLIVMARDWDLRIQLVYPKGSAGYIRLLPYGRTPFYSGRHEMRIRAISQLSLAIGNDPQLADVKASINNCYTALTAAYIAQREKISLVEAASHTLEKTRIAICNALNYVLCGLRQHFVATPLVVNGYFRLDLIRNTRVKTSTTNAALHNDVVEADHRVLEPVD